jgi:hypothetical protein
VIVERIRTGKLALHALGGTAAIASSDGGATFTAVDARAGTRLTHRVTLNAVAIAAKTTVGCLSRKSIAGTALIRVSRAALSGAAGALQASTSVGDDRVLGGCHTRVDANRLAILNTEGVGTRIGTGAITLAWTGAAGAALCRALSTRIGARDGVEPANVQVAKVTAFNAELSSGKPKRTLDAPERARKPASSDKRGGSCRLGGSRLGRSASSAGTASSLTLLRRKVDRTRISGPSTRIPFISARAIAAGACLRRNRQVTGLRDTQASGGERLETIGSTKLVFERDAAEGIVPRLRNDLSPRARAKAVIAALDAHSATIGALLLKTPASNALGSLRAIAAVALKTRVGVALRVTLTTSVTIDSPATL